MPPQTPVPSSSGRGRRQDRMGPGGALAPWTRRAPQAGHRSDLLRPPPLRLQAARDRREVSSVRDACDCLPS
jgi:hypothetical protein